MPEQEPWYLAVCMECNRGMATPNPVPFEKKEDRWAWVDAHLTTGHQVLLLNQARRRPWYIEHAEETGHETYKNTITEGCRGCVAKPPVMRLEKVAVRRG